MWRPLSAVWPGTVGARVAGVIVLWLTLSVVPADVVATGRVGTATALQMLVDHQIPGYPLPSLRAGKSGLAVASLDIDHRGTVVAVRLDRSPDQFMAEAVRARLTRWRFQPLTNDGKPMRLKTRIFVYFRLDRPGGSVTIAGLEAGPK